MRQFSFFILIVYLCAMSRFSFADTTELSASIDKNPVLIDESLSLQVIARGGADKDAIDFSVLSKDFRVSGPSVSQSTQIINFDRTTTTSWTLQLFPRRTGDLLIPSFTVDGKSSQPITVSVLDVSQADSSQPRDFFVDTSLNYAEVYLQQQVLYTVKIYLAGDIQRGSLSEPVLEGAVIEQLGDDKEYQELLNGVRYRVIERNFAVLPQASGEFTIEGPVFQAEVLTSTRQSFAFFNRSKTISRVAPEQNLIVKPIPQDYQYTWLPSEQVQLSEEWQGTQGEFIQGEPVTRTVTLTALGLIEEQLPDISAQYHPSFKTYPEQAEKATVEQNNRLIAQLVQRTAVIPGEAGSFVLPEINVPWFDVNSGTTRFASLPARTVTVVAPALNQANSEPEPSADTSSREQEDNQSPQDDAQENDVKQTSKLFQPLYGGLDLLHFLLITALILLLIVLSVCVAIISRRRNDKPVALARAQKADNTEEDAWKNLNQALEQSDVAGAQTHLRKWLSLFIGKSIQSVSHALGDLDAAKANEAYKSLLSAQYSASESVHSNERCRELQDQLKQVRESHHIRRKEHSHTNMYPIV